MWCSQEAENVERQSTYLEKIPETCKFRTLLGGKIYQNKKR